MSDAELLTEVRGSLGLLTLNRPKALNALTLGMVHAMVAQLKVWAEDPAISTVAVRGAGDRAFCAGGDVRALWESGMNRTEYASTFWHDEYQLNTLIKEYPKPYVALIHGLVMGGGVGVSFHGSHRVVCETTGFAMPETGIGLFPDVGGTYFLPRLPGQSGLYLALTGARVKAADLRHLGLATHIAAYADFEPIIAALAAGAEPDSVLAPYVANATDAPIRARQEEIDALFCGDGVEAILAALDRAQTDFARETAATIRTKSPTSLKIAYRQMVEGRRHTFRECMKLEFRVTERIQQGEDFYEGVRAIIIDKDNAPRWSPARVEDVTDAAIDACFAPLPSGELTFL